MKWLYRNNTSKNSSIDAIDMLSIAVTCAMVPLLSPVLSLIWGDNPLWGADRMFSVYFAVFSGRVLMEKLQLVFDQCGLRGKGYAFMDFDAAGKVVYAFPVLLPLFCWNSAAAMIILLSIFVITSFVLCMDRNIIKFNVFNTSGIGLLAVLLKIPVNVLISFIDINYSQDFTLAVFIALLLSIIGLNAFRDYLRIKKKG